MSSKPTTMAMAVVILALALMGYFAAGSRGEVREDGSIELMPATTINAAGVTNKSTGLLAPLPRGRVVKFHRKLTGLVHVYRAGGTGATLDVYFQSSPDNGLTWQDFAHVQCGGSAPAPLSFKVPIVLYCDSGAFPTAVPTTNDGALAAATISPQSGIGERIRVKYNAAFANVQGAAWTFDVVIKPD